MRISRWVLLWGLIVAVLLAVELSIIVGIFTPDPIGTIFNIIYALTLISILSIIGAVFLGMVVSHRILSVKGFTPFEQEMLQMRQEVRELSERVAEIGSRLGMAVGSRKKPP